MTDINHSIDHCRNDIHKYKCVGYYSSGFGISTDCEVLWCSYCGAIKKNRVTRPEVSKKPKKWFTAAGA